MAQPFAALYEQPSSSLQRVLVWFRQTTSFPALSDRPLVPSPKMLFDRSVARAFVGTLRLPKPAQQAHEVWLAAPRKPSKRARAAANPLPPATAQTIDGLIEVANDSWVDPSSEAYQSPGQAFPDLLCQFALTPDGVEFSSEGRFRKLNELPVAAAIALIKVPVDGKGGSGAGDWSAPFFVVMGTPAAGVAPGSLGNESSPQPAPPAMAPGTRLQPCDVTPPDSVNVIAASCWGKSRASPTATQFFKGLAEQRASQLFFLEGFGLTAPCHALSQDGIPAEGNPFRQLWASLNKEEWPDIQDGEEPVTIDGRKNPNTDAEGLWILPGMIPLPRNHGLPVGAILPPNVCTSAEAFVEAVASLIDAPQEQYMWLQCSPVDAWFRAMSSAAAQMARPAFYYTQIADSYTQWQDLAPESAALEIPSTIIVHRFTLDYFAAVEAAARTKWQEAHLLLSNALTVFNNGPAPLGQAPDYYLQPFLMALADPEPKGWKKLFASVRALMVQSHALAQYALFPVMQQSELMPVAYLQPMPHILTPPAAAAFTPAGARSVASSTGALTKASVSIESYINGWNQKRTSLSPPKRTTAPGGASSLPPPSPAKRAMVPVDLTALDDKAPPSFKRFRAEPVEPDDEPAMCIWELPVAHPEAGMLASDVSKALARKPRAFLLQNRAPELGRVTREEYIAGEVSMQTHSWQLFGTFSMPSLPQLLWTDGEVVEEEWRTTPGVIGQAWATLFLRPSSGANAAAEKVAMAKNLLIAAWQDADENPAPYSPVRPAWCKHFMYDEVVLTALATGRLSSGHHLTSRAELMGSFTPFHLLASVQEKAIDAQPGSTISLPRAGLQAEDMARLVQNFLFVANAIWGNAAVFPELPPWRSPSLFRGVFVEPLYHLMSALRSEEVRRFWSQLSQETRRAYTKTVLVMIGHLIWFCDGWYAHDKKEEAFIPAVSRADLTQDNIFLFTHMDRKQRSLPDKLKTWKAYLSLLLDGRQVGHQSVTGHPYYELDPPACLDQPLDKPAQQGSHTSTQQGSHTSTPSSASHAKGAAKASSADRAASTGSTPNNIHGTYAGPKGPKVSAPHPLLVWAPEAQPTMTSLFQKMRQNRHLRFPKLVVNGAENQICFAYCVAGLGCSASPCPRLHVNVKSDASWTAATLAPLSEFIQQPEIRAIFRPSPDFASLCQPTT